MASPKARDIPHFLSPLSLSLLFFISTCQTQEISTDPSYYYNLCGSSTCGNLSLSYPFAVPSFCHNPEVMVSCPGDGYLHLSSKRQTGSLRVIGGFTTDPSGSKFYVAFDSLFGCGSVSRPSYVVDPGIFSLSSNYTYGTHLNCTRAPSSTQTLQPVSCLGCNSSDGNICFYSPGFLSFPECEQFFLFTPVWFNVSAEKDLRGNLQRGFMIAYSMDATCQSCKSSGGRCGTSPTGSFVCFCANSVHQTSCSDGMAVDLKTWLPAHRRSGPSTTLIAALSASIAVVTAITLATLVYLFAIRRNRKTLQDKESPIDDSAMTQVGLRDLVSEISPTRYSYSQVKKFTKNFSSKLGEGGFGTIYKGIIQQNKCDMPVAVKLLKRLKQREKQFMNEVATIGRIHHTNLVRLLGYSVKGTKRVLVYEFMENGSLDQYIYNAKKGKEEQQGECDSKCLSPKQKYRIALETARGILYLHQGCRSRILHCDIKPHNILLDTNFSAKVADFGLARMIDKDYSHVSLTVAQGTPGYAAPEVWSKSYGPITEKTDVYSYGMLILEMAGGRKNHELIVAGSGQIYFPEGALKRDSCDSIEVDTGGRDGDDEEEVLQKMWLVGLWCIQHIPSNRPSMVKVLQMLEGNVEIGTPPNPFPQNEGEAHRNDLTSTVYFTAPPNPFPHNEGEAHRNDLTSTVYFTDMNETQ